MLIIIILDDIAKKQDLREKKMGLLILTELKLIFLIKKKTQKNIFQKSEDSNKLIEEFVIANKNVAEVFNEIKRQSIFTDYDLPDKENQCLNT